MTQTELDALMAAVAGVVREYVDQRVAAVPEGKEGPPGAPGEPGKDADPAEVRSMVEALVAALPAPKDGERGEKGDPGERGAPGEPGPAGPAGEAGPPGTDGRDGAPGASVTLEEVMPTLEAGMTKWLAEVERRAVDQVQRAIDAIPRPRDGVDGLGIEDMAVEDDGDGNVTIRFSRGEVSREFLIRLPRFKDCGVFREGTYRQGDGVTFGGSLWLAQKDDPPGKPGDPDSGWRLAVKKGRDGRDAPGAEKGPGATGPVRLK